MRWMLRRQLVVAYSLVIVVAVAITSGVAAWGASHRADREVVRQLQSIVRNLTEVQFPLTNSVLERIRGLSGAEFLVRSRSGTITASTWSGAGLSSSNQDPSNGVTVEQLESLPSDLPDPQDVSRISEFPVIETPRGRHFVGVVRLQNADLFVLFPERNWIETRFGALVPVMVAGAISCILAVLISDLLARRLSQRIASVREQLGRMAAHDYTVQEPNGLNDELLDLQRSANELALRLEGLEQQAAHSERMRILAQIASGLAHQLRNAVTGARMAVQIHQRRCQADPNDDSLNIGLRQLELTEAQIRSLLSSSQSGSTPPVPARLKEILKDVQRLLTPVAEHCRVKFQVKMEGEDWDFEIPDSELMRGAILNLCWNAMEAGGADSEAILQAHEDEQQIRVTVKDTGAGLDPEIQKKFGEPFVTTKREGVGLGLLQARQAAESLHGELKFRREGNWTLLELSWPKNKGPN